MPSSSHTILFTTERLLIRELIIEDAPFVFELMNSADYIRFIGDKQINSIEAAQAHIKNDRIKSYKTYGFGLWLVELKDSNTPVGTCGLLKREASKEVDIGYAFLPAYYHKGYAFEAAKATINFAAKEFHLNKLIAYTNSKNKASISLLKKLGFVYNKEVELSENDFVLLFSLIPEFFSIQNTRNLKS